MDLVGSDQNSIGANSNLKSFFWEEIRGNDQFKAKPKKKIFPIILHKIDLFLEYFRFQILKLYFPQ